ncbi:MAG: ferrous iron transport protein B [Marinilabiliaceae bacterium]|nr:ferrous iron transport protein B [Marinilabiliaceae bacterium]
MKLSDLPSGQDAVITDVAGSGAFRKRIIEMGFVKGKLVKSIRNAPLNDPIEYRIMDYYVSLRRAEADLITIDTVNIDTSNQKRSYPTAEEDGAHMPTERREPKQINIALVGNPNCGKTTLYNYLSGANEHTGNYSGVTIGASETKFNYKGYIFHLIDLPGTYSISPYSPEETFVRTKILELDPDIVLNVIDTTNIARNLYLTTQLIDMEVRAVAALNMYDEFEKTNTQLDYVQLGRMIGISMVPTVGSKGRGTHALLDKFIEVYEGTDTFTRRIKINYGIQIEQTISKICDYINSYCTLPAIIPARYVAIKIIENDMDFVWNHVKSDNIQDRIGEMVKMRNELRNSLDNNDLDAVLSDMRYGFIDGALEETLHNNPNRSSMAPTKSQRIDNLLTHRFWGIPIFVLAIWIMFQCTFKLGQYPMDWIDSCVNLIASQLDLWMPDGILKELIVDGIIKGVGGVIIFLPNILILFLFISFMEDTGYMARAAFIMDKMMHKMGLHGKSFIPLIMGFGCNVPAIMATRTIEDRKNRMLTMMVNPFMSCSARLPVFILFCGAFFPDNAGTALFSIYLFGVLMAVVVCRLFKRVLFNGPELPFVMELPPYRLPTIRTTLLNMWNKASQYLSKMGGIILVASIIIWFLGYFPKSNDLEEERLYSVEAAKILFANSPDRLSTAIDSIECSYLSKSQEYSMIGRIGRFIEPAIEPLGFDWKMGVSLVSAVAAKEIVVSTLAVLYKSPGDEDDNNNRLIQNLRNETHNGKPVFTPPVVISFLLFTLLYFPCLATLTAIKNETAHWNDFNTASSRRRQHKGSWRWAIFVATYTTMLAWVVAYLAYHILSFFGL